MTRACVLALVLVGAASCDEPPMPDESCPTQDQMVCGKTGGTSVALLCNAGKWEYVANCMSCDHVLGCKTELICDNVNKANNGLHCDVQNVGACDFNRPHLLLKCESNNEWTTFADCSTMGMTCGRLPDGNLGCI